MIFLASMITFFVFLGVIAFLIGLILMWIAY